MIGKKWGPVSFTEKHGIFDENFLTKELEAAGEDAIDRSWEAK